MNANWAYETYEETRSTCVIVQSTSLDLHSGKDGRMHELLLNGLVKVLTIHACFRSSEPYFI